jgi:hypothetical protein
MAGNFWNPSRIIFHKDNLAGRTTAKPKFRILAGAEDQKITLVCDKLLDDETILFSGHGKVRSRMCCTLKCLSQAH